MELIAATMARCIDVLKELHMLLNDCILDRYCFCTHLSGTKLPYSVFVANQVLEIRKTSQPSLMRYVKTGRNPPEASRGVKVDAFLKNATWVSGTHFLLQPESKLI